MRRLLIRLARSDRGNFAVIAALALVPVAGLAGLGVDYSQAYSARTTLQGEADAIAIAVASEGPGAASRFYEAMRAEAAGRVALGTASFQGAWVSPTDYRVVATAKVPRTLSRLIPVGSGEIDVSTESLARYMGARLVYKTPQSMILDPDAWDYNEINAYCFNAETGGSNKAEGRSKRVAIADNEKGTRKVDGHDVPLPQCAPGEVLSFELRNIIEGKHRPGNKDNPSNVRNYYLDASRDSEDRDSYTLEGKGTGPKTEMLETILCTSLEVCVEEPAGIIPVGSNRAPRKNTSPCKPGHFMYYGWEDRPNGDRDFNDIRIVIECPQLVKVGEESVRLLR